MFYRFIILLFFIITNHLYSQTGVKGYVRDINTGNELENANVIVVENKMGRPTNSEGFYLFNEIDPGNYTLEVTFVGYDTVRAKIKIEDNKVLVQNFYLSPLLYSVSKGFKKEEKKKKEVKESEVGTTKITSGELLKIPTVGGVPDLVQYLQILPGVVFSGDQGGQLYIRGGSPVMNKILLDGMTIYNPFHSIGLFSIFDAELIKSADVYSAGFGAEYGGRVSAIVDVKTRDGNRNKLSGNFALSPFLGKVSLEGPLKKFRPNQGNSSFVFSIKNSYLDKSAHLFYPYANPDNLPYSFNDVYAKVSMNAANGSNIKLFGFNFKDRVNFPNSTHYNWNQSGFGVRFTMIPEGKLTKLDGFVTYSGYQINQEEIDNKPRTSGINGFNMGVNALTYKGKNEIKYGFDINGFRTNFEIYNSNDRKISQYENTTELCGYFLYKFIRKKLLLELGVREQYYASLGNASFEPRINGRFKLSDKWAVKAAGGKYSQNLLSAFSDRDVVNLFYGFLSGPDDLPKRFDNKDITKKLQLAWHGVAGIEYDINKYSDISSEVFYKNFTQITNINRDKLFDDIEEYAAQPERLRKNYILEKGNAYGADIRYKYDNKRLYLWAVYSLTYVNRYDGIINYNPHWDRRHNINLVGDYALDKSGKLSFNVRWNFGSGFPFTQTQGFYEKLDFAGGPSSNYPTTNGEIGILYSGFNEGRLPTYHRLDASVKYNFKPINKFKSWLVLSVTNIYNRANIFYFDRVNYTRVNQLPILPSISYNASF